MAKTNPKVFQNPVATKGASQILRASSPVEPERSHCGKRWRPSDAEIISVIERRLADVLDTVSDPPTAEQISEIRRLEKLIATVRQSGTKA